MASLKSPWELPVQYLKGVGEKLGKIFDREDISNFWDLLLFLPRTYEDRRKLATFQDLSKAAVTGEVIMGLGVIDRVDKQKGFGGRGRIEALCSVREIDEQGHALSGGPDYVKLVWFYDPGGIAQRFPPGSGVIFRGKVQRYQGQFQIVHPELKKSDGPLAPWEFGGWVPVYKEISGLSTRVTRRIVSLALDREELKLVPESLPDELRERLKLPSIQESLREIHFPKNWEPNPENESKPEGRFLARLAFEELFMMALTLQMRKNMWGQKAKSRADKLPQIAVSDEMVSEEAAVLPYKLTGDQQKTLKEILGDFSYNKMQAPMHRLVQGDVGSGKTAVAFLASIVAMKSGYQVALMAPTEILADQHFANFKKLFPKYAEKCFLLKGALTVKKKKEVRALLEKGEAQFIIGTQALIAEDTVFEKLGLVIIDEQHRFGVEQRLGLKKGAEGVTPHLLVMTATPIPRSLALTVYGDLDLSLILEKPAGRQPIETHIIKRRTHAKLRERLKKFVDEGRQIYIVYPLVEESEEVDMKDVKNAFQEWTDFFGPNCVDLLHGRMKSAEKDQAFTRFREGQTKVLVSTTVIEVGVDVPNASVIVIEHAERFGLSQLHQLRGRVGRGSEKSYCILIGPDNPSPMVGERLEIMAQSDDGFRIAEKDLEIRGPGEFLGRRQSGMPGFRVAHILRDAKMLELARLEAESILESDPLLSTSENQKLRDMIQRWWAGRLELTMSG
jgi:ATP-dependent DNA helicase RecG